MIGEKYYVTNSVPFKQVDNLAVGEEYITEKGYLIKYVGENDVKVLKISPLRTEEYSIEDLDNVNAIKLFWTLLKNS